MIKTTPLNDKLTEQFKKLFTQYYAELDCGDDAPDLIEEYIIPDLLAGLINIELLSEGEDFVGFVIYQIDDITNDWNLKEGWGDIREIYISPSSRRQGYGKFLLFTAEMKLKEKGADKVYALPYEGAIRFFADCGYASSGVYNEDLDCFVFEKTNLNNCCK